MKSIQTITTGLSLAVLALAGSSCQDMNSFFTGEQFSRAPEGSPRVETELTVQIDESFVAAFASVDQAVELGGATSDLVLSLADVGTRFYPVMADEYASKKVRPDYLMAVEVDDLTFEFGTETTEHEGEEPSVRMFVTSVSCVAKASVQRRRKHAPPLVVGESQGVGKVHIRGEVSAEDEEATYAVRSGADDGQMVLVHRQDILDAAERAVVDALRDVVRSVDREFATQPE